MKDVADFWRPKWCFPFENYVLSGKNQLNCYKLFVAVRIVGESGKFAKPAAQRTHQRLFDSKFK